MIREMIIIKVYLKSKQDWIDFVNGGIIVVYRNPVDNYYKEILVANNEVVSVGYDTVKIVKKYQSR